MEDLVALHWIYKLAMLSGLWIFFFWAFQEYIEDLLHIFSDPIAHRLGACITFFGAVCVFSIALAIVYFAYTLFAG